ncbi:exodeoxyribonuclease VII large subunit [Methanomassiliicoccales archaeon LGM-RCC1]|nr:exodeoxyribonuclease VII large subunit [Methanomassiliicoccales archaeon LGM-RCC1]
MPEVITVTQLNTRVKELFSRTVGLSDIWVSGEISGLTKSTSGHYYFVLKDEGSEIRCALFKGSRARIDFEPTENMKVRMFGRVDIYVARGSYQFIVETMEKSGVGDRYVAFEKLKKKLSDEGLFAESHKRKLPLYPKTIGVVTSQTGAVIHDIITTSESRYTADILLAPAMVQGEGSAESIVAGIELLNKAGVDVIIVGRGGGSIEDLWAFNEEIVARAIYNSKVPVVSAVGHETDFTIADFVADLRAPTPTGAAALILRDKSEMRSEISSFMTRLNRAISSVLDEMQHSFEVLDSRLDPQRGLDALSLQRMRIENLSKSADRALVDKMHDMILDFEGLEARLQPSRALDDMENKKEYVEASLERINVGIMTSVREKESELSSYSKQLEGVNPLNVLTRGYSMITGPGGKVLTTIDNVNVGDSVTIHMRDGRAEADIKSKEMKE